MEKARILIVDDDDLVSAFLRSALAGLAGDVDVCPSGSEAMEAVEQRHYGVILLDGLLPDIHGIDLARLMLGHPNTRRSGVCFVSGWLRRRQPLVAGVSAFPKPLRVRELRDAIEQLIAWHHNPTGSLADRLDALDALRADLLVG